VSANASMFDDGEDGDPIAAVPRDRECCGGWHDGNRAGDDAVYAGNEWSGDA
jgi:hypothetical protein